MLRDIFGRIQGHDPAHHYEVFASYIEVYKERIYDLLAVSKSKPLKPRMDKSRGLYLPAAQQVTVRNIEEADRVLKLGNRNREMAATKMNIMSNRSHSIFLLTLLQTDVVEGMSKVSQLYLVDLAGSEKVCKTGAEGERLEEAKKINVSLLALENVISALNNTKKAKHIPYRDSKLTFILANAFGGNSRTAMVCCMSESSWNAQESLSTLRFGERARNVQNAPRVNQERSLEQLKAMLSRAEKRINLQDRVIGQLRDKLARFQDVMKLILPTELADSSAVLSLEEMRKMRGDMISKLRAGLDPSDAPSHRSQDLNSPDREGSSSGSSSMSDRQLLNFRQRIEELEWENEKYKQNLVQVPPQFIDPVAKTLLVDPVIASDGHTYERATIVQWLATHSTSPMTGEHMRDKSVFPNHTLRSLILSNPVLSAYIEQHKVIQVVDPLEDEAESSQLAPPRVFVRDGGLFLFANSQSGNSELSKLANL